jgi:VWFA-related protein
MALVVDDLTLTVESTPYVKQALKKFVDEQMRPGDLVAIVRTGAGMGALQMFTADKRVLYAAIDRVRWSPSSNTLYTFAPVTTNMLNPNRSSPLGERTLSGDARRGANDPLMKVPERASDEMDRLRREMFSVGTLGALQFIVGALRELPGRKSVVLFSEGLSIYNREQNLIRVREALRKLTDLANRSSTVIYTIDARGLQPLNITAADDLSGDVMPGRGENQPQWLAESRAFSIGRADEFIESQEGLNYLAQQTGGFFIKNTNDLNGGVRRVMKDQDSYYLIGFVPEASTFKGGEMRGFHDLKVKVNRPEARVRTRSGFFGITDEETRSVEKAFGQSLMTALTSPFNSGDIALRLTSGIGLDQKKGVFVSSLLHIDAGNLTFAPEANGQRKTSFEVAAFTFGDNGSVVDKSIRSYVVRMTEREYEHTLKTGIFYRVNLPIKKPGAYQLRTAVRDSASLKVGSANQFIEVPDLTKGKLALSGLIVRGSASSSPPQMPDRAANTNEGRTEESDPQASPAVRRFRQGMIVEYAYAIYGAKPDRTTGRPELATQLRLYRDDKLVFDGGLRSYDPQTQRDLKQLFAGGSIKLGRDLTPGDYSMQVIVTDKLAKEKDQLSSAWIDFEIVQ